MFERFRERWRQRLRRDGLYTKAGYWNGKAETHTGSAVSMFINHSLNERLQQVQFAFFDAALGDVQGCRILDVGCGTGRLSRHLAMRGASVTGIDFSEKSIDIARKESEGLRIDYRVDSVFNIDLHQECDAVVVLGCLTVACNTPEEFESVIRRLYAALRPGSTLVIIEPFHRSFLRRVLRLAKPEVIRLLASAGFEVVETREMHFWPTRLLLTLGETPGWITRSLYPVGEMLLRVSPEFLRFGDYKAIVARRQS